MVCIVLAAGYATRLYPLTENFPKPLLKVKEKTILDWLLDDIDTSKEITKYVVISNDRYYSHFVDWSKSKSLSAPIVVLNDGTTSNETRLGAVKDIQFAIETLNIDDDVLVIAGDNVLDFSLTQFISYFKEKRTSVVMRYYEESYEKLKKCGIVIINADDLIADMVEKSPNPNSHWCVPPFYIYSKSDCRKVEEGIKQGCGTDAPGSYIAWLCKQSPVHAMEMKGKRYDIGNLRVIIRCKRSTRVLVFEPVNERGWKYV